MAAPSSGTQARNAAVGGSRDIPSLPVPVQTGVGTAGALLMARKTPGAFQMGNVHIDSQTLLSNSPKSEVGSSNGPGVYFPLLKHTCGWCLEWPWAGAEALRELSPLGAV